MASSVYRLVIVISLILLVASLNPIDAYVEPPMTIATLAVDPADAAIASNITSRALVEAKHKLRTAYETTVTQADVSRHLDTLMRADGADGDLSFPTLVMSGFELTSPHGDPLDDSTHVINPAIEPVVMIDIGSKFNGHCSDVTRTFFFETATQEMHDAYSAVLAAEEAVIAAVGPGVAISSLDALMGTYLQDYVGVPGISLLTYWGHGVGEYVHEMPILHNTAGELAVDDILAIEPGIYSDDGWAVRVEDTVRVTATGVEILSDAPKALEDVMVLQNQPYVDAEITVSDYDYGSDVIISLVIDDSASRDVLSVNWSNGYSWIEMQNFSKYYFQVLYHLNYSYSGHIECMAKVQLSNDTYYFGETTTADVEASEQLSLNPVLHLDDTILPPDSLILMSYSQPVAEMIRIRFGILDAGHDQLLVEESDSHFVLDFKEVSEKYVWTPWVAGDTVRIHVIATEPDFLGGVDTFSFTIDTVEYYDADIPPTTTTTTPTQTTTTPDTTTTTTDTTTTTIFPDPPPDDSWLSPIIITSGIIVVLVILVSVRTRR